MSHVEAQKPLPSEMNDYSLLDEDNDEPSCTKVINVWCTYVSALLAFLQMAYGIGLTFYFFFSLDKNYDKWELPGAMVLAIVFTGFVVQASAMFVILGHIRRQPRYLILGCVFPFLECLRTSFIVLKSVYEILFDGEGEKMSEQGLINAVNGLVFIAFLASFFAVSFVVHIKTAHIIEHNEDLVDEEE